MLTHALLVTLALATTPSTTPEKAAPALHQVEQNIIHYTNLERQRHGLPPLVVDNWLLNSARRHCAWMARAGSLTHTSAAVAENIAMGQTSSLQAVRDWMNSPGHRANILGRYTRIGAAAYTARNGTTYWCVQFLH